MTNTPQKRRRIAIKTRVTLFYTVLVLLSCGVMLFLFLSGAQQTVRAYDEDLLLEAMTSAADTVLWQDNMPAMQQQDAVDFNRVSFALYDAHGNLWRGKWPPFTLSFEDGAVRSVKDASGVDRLCQDLRLSFPEGDLWLRGHIALDDMRFLQHASASRMLLILPVMLVLCALGGYLLTLRAFSSISSMARQADSIADGQDLTRRFDTGAADKPDEIGQLARTFNHMFDRLNAAFIRERQFTDDASHELRTPVAVITSACDYALSQDDPAEYREALLVIREKAGSMNDMLTQLLQLARMDAGRVAIARETVDFSRLCRETAQEMGKGRDRALDLTGIMSGLVLEGDELLLMRVVVNLLDNALKFSRTAVSMSLRREGGLLVLRVMDDGPGMTQEVAARVFDRFYQAAPDRSAQSSGAGLGLSMALSICRLHGGELCVEHTDESGSVFRATFPATEKS